MTTQNTNSEGASKCLYCGETMPMSVTWKKYCSNSCRSLAYQHRQGGNEPITEKKFNEKVEKTLEEKKSEFRYFCKKTFLGNLLADSDIHYFTKAVFVASEQASQVCANLLRNGWNETSKETYEKRR